MCSVMKNHSIYMGLNIGMKHRREKYYECTRYDKKVSVGIWRV